MKFIQKLNLYTFPFIWVIALSISILEDYKYFGFFQKHFFIPALVFYLLSLLSFTGFVVSGREFKKMIASELFAIFSGFGMILFFVFLALYVVLNELEIAKYTNYSYSVFHIWPGSLIFSALIAFESAYLFFAFNRAFSKSRQRTATILDLVSFGAPLFVLFAYFCLSLDTLKYPGFVSKHFLIDARVYMALAFVLLLVHRAKRGLLMWILKVNRLVLMISFLAYVYFSFMEATHYTNFVLSRYHFSLDGLIYILLFSAAIFLSEKVKVMFEKVRSDGFMWIIIFFASYTLLVNLGAALKTSSTADIYVLLHPRDSYDQKMHYQWGNYYDYMHFVKNNTPEDSMVIIPPQIAPWWTRSGNMALVRYFLYPRNLVQYPSEEIPDIKSLSEGTFIMVAWGEWQCEREGVCRGWPVQKVFVKEAIFKDPYSSAVKEIKNNFLYDPEDTSTPFGLLRL